MGNKRPESEIIKDLKRVESSLEPECLTCDGELPRSEVKRRYSRLMTERKKLVAELGREPTQMEIWGF